ncbi:MAG: Septum site-determining protein MinC [Legionellaceae bacterium]
MTLNSTTLESPKTAVFQLKGSLFTLTVMQLLEIDWDAFTVQIEAMANQAPKFFSNTPIVIDLQKLITSEMPINLKLLITLIRKHGLIPMGIRGGNEEYQSQALELGLALLPETKNETLKEKAKPIPATLEPQTSKVITSQVRSGQQIYAKGSDLIVLAPVSPGAELLADGHIHVYGPLRGRALAGVSGNTNARIFTQSLEAELISIAGNYWVKEDLKNINEQQALQVYLEEERLKIHYLNS